MIYHGDLYKGPNIRCKDCTERYPACHDHCETYQKGLEEWVETKRMIKRNKRTVKEYNSFIIENTIKSKRR